VTLLSTKDAAHAAGVSVQTIYSWHRRGKLTRYGTARAARWCVRELVRLAHPAPPPSLPRRDLVRRLLDADLTGCKYGRSTTGRVATAGRTSA
jgi:hypothetical protein